VAVPLLNVMVAASIRGGCAPHGGCAPCDNGCARLYQLYNKRYTRKNDIEQRSGSKNSGNMTL
jgi:hypothetical protein